MKQPIEVIKNELMCVQRNCCRVENECAKCDLVLPLEDIVFAYKHCIELLQNEIKGVEKNQH